ncbi:MAG: hypothetical protein KBS94_02685 [Prevotella sp.]|nr:hypothetical protein [Candidatus Equicola faecalis]
MQLEKTFICIFINCPNDRFLHYLNCTVVFCVLYSQIETIVKLYGPATSNFSKRESHSICNVFFGYTFNGFGFGRSINIEIIILVASGCTNVVLITTGDFRDSSDFFCQQLPDATNE